MSARLRVEPDYLSSPEAMLYRDLVRRFWGKVEVTPGCWIWTGAVAGTYGRFWRGTKYVQAHRFSYELFVGAIPDGLAIDHVRDRGCTSRICVNPAHLEPVTTRENVQRYTRLITHCPRGHEYTHENTRIDPTGRRHCRACDTVRAIRPCANCGEFMQASHLVKHRTKCGVGKAES